MKSIQNDLNSGLGKIVIGPDSTWNFQGLEDDVFFDKFRPPFFFGGRYLILERVDVSWIGLVFRKNINALELDDQSIQDSDDLIQSGYFGSSTFPDFSEVIHHQPSKHMYRYWIQLIRSNQLRLFCSDVSSVVIVIYCIDGRNPRQPPGMYKTLYLNSGIDYQPQLVQDFFHQQYLPSVDPHILILIRFGWRTNDFRWTSCRPTSNAVAGSIGSGHPMWRDRIICTKGAWWHSRLFLGATLGGLDSQGISTGIGGMFLKGKSRIHDMLIVCCFNPCRWKVFTTLM